MLRIYLSYERRAHKLLIKKKYLKRHNRIIGIIKRMRNNITKIAKQTKNNTTTKKIIKPP